jgi:hypothetical protein
MKNQKTFRVQITNDTFIAGEHIKAGKVVDVAGEDAFVLVSNNKGRLADNADDTKSKK